MKSIIGLLLIICTLLSCKAKNTVEVKTPSLPIEGTWKLITGTLVEKGVSTVTQYTKDVSFIKIINGTHFAFLLHDLKKGKDTAATYSSGGGPYTLKDSSYTEHLEYCSDRGAEGYDFTFTISINNDTLIQHGIEKIESQGIERMNTEVYVRVKR